MSRALLDASVLIALLDEDHTFHDAAHHWISSIGKRVWASCPITENAVARVMSNPRYSTQRKFTIPSVIKAIRGFVEHTDHEFWPDSISISDRSLFDTEKVHGPKQITDLYLLALAVSMKGRLVTFDTRMSISPILQAERANLVIIGRQ